MNAELLWVWAAAAIAAVVLVGVFWGPRYWAGIAWIGRLVLVVGLGTLTYQVILSFQAGSWVDWQFGEALATVGLGNFPENWDDADSLLRSVVRLPMGAGIMGTGFVIACIGTVGKAFAPPR